MRFVAGCLLILGLAVCGACNKKSATAGPRATVMLRDGTSFAGNVIKSSPAEITLVAPNGETRTFQMSQVDNVQYAEPAAPAPATTPAPAAAPEQNPAAQVPQGQAPPQQAAAPQASQAQAPPPQETPPAAVERIVPAGTHLTVRTNVTIDSKTAAPGQTYPAVIVRDVFDSDRNLMIPHGSPATLVVRAVREQGKVEGQSLLALDIDSVAIGARRYRVEAADIVEKGHPGVGANKRTAKFAGGGAVLGTLLGAVAGGGRGAAIGLFSGAAAGTAAQTVTRGKGVRVPAETLLTFRLESPIRIREIQ
jgi:hypothetical protein